ncbi:receptor-type tyrosine-protein phosphatase C-like [Centropristis striata]|uniref:receptor-type tyrosine-protein phosphatase C-like n=1 Tax=Centropristis striata TaxID=184440 RepID=UPI0027E1EBC8|nr:receptor-type tyrosine-protein phosphatase C-like [Centropristis striata]
MAGLCGVKVLLLWAGIIGSANCQVTTGPKDVSTLSDSTQTQTSPPITTSNTTVIPTTEGPQAPPPPQCSYTVTPIKFGFQIEMKKNSTPGNYTINISEVGQQGARTTSIVQLNKKLTHEIKHLKPCTKYEHAVKLIDGAGTVTPCYSTDNKTTTTVMEKGDITDGSCMPGYVCYRSDWDISSSLSKPNNLSPCKSDKTQFCIKPGHNDTCTDLTTTFTSGHCNNSFSLTKEISVDFLNASEIRQIPPKGIPAKINATFPRNCNNLTADYTCQEKGTFNDTKPESELEPFTEYSCTGQIKNNNVSINKNTKDIKFTIDCDITINVRHKGATSDSINLTWTTTSQNCKYLPSDPKLSYVCSCVPTSKSKPITHGAVNTCDVTGLEAFKDHTCKVQPKYNDRIVSKPKEVEQKTAPGVPDDISSVSVMNPEHNVIRVTCTHSGRFNGPKKLYVAKLFHDRVLQKELTNSKCNFEFKDLSYSTEYDLEVTADNGHHISKNPKRELVSTSYNDKAFIIRLVIFLVFTIITCVAVGVAVYKIFIWRRRKSRNGGNEDIMLETTAIYANIPGPERQH